jgi:hypothetical protein
LWIYLGEGIGLALGLLIALVVIQPWKTPDQGGQPPFKFPGVGEVVPGPGARPSAALTPSGGPLQWEIDSRRPGAGSSSSSSFLFWG